MSQFLVDSALARAEEALAGRRHGACAAGREFEFAGPARKHYRWWRNWAVRSRLKPIAEKARMVHRRFENVVTYIRHRITNAASESINSKIEWVKYTARGFRNTSNFITAIYSHSGGLGLMPSTH